MSNTQISDLNVEDLKDWLNTSLARVMYASNAKVGYRRRLYANVDSTFTVDFIARGKEGSENFDTPEKAVNFFNSCYE